MDIDDMTLADQLLLGVMKAIEHNVWELAEVMARRLAVHIHTTGEYPSALQPEELDNLVAQHRAAGAFGPS
jgi:hypothetical protein